MIPALDMPAPATPHPTPLPRPAGDPSLAGPGEIVELRGGVGRTSFAMLEVARAQQRGEPVAWIQPARGLDAVHAVDLEAAGVDLETLVVVRVPPRVFEVLAAAEVLLRSGGFGLVVCDLSGSMAGIATRATSRLARLVREHDARAMLLTDEGVGEVGPLVRLRVRPRLQRAPEAVDAPVLVAEVQRDKRGDRRGLPQPRMAWPEGASAFDRVPDVAEEARGRMRAVPA